MKRADRLEPVQRVMDDTERRLAEHLAASERLVLECQARLKELESYRDDYAKNFARRAGVGMNARALHDYQSFMTRLQEAIKQQEHIVQDAITDRDVQRNRWQEAAQRAKSLGHVIERWELEEQHAEQKREQKLADEFAQRRKPTPQD